MKQFPMFASLSAVLLVVGLRQLVTATRSANDASQKMVNASPFRRLWLPAGWYSKHTLLWQFRVMGAMIIVLSVMAAFVAVLAYRHGL